MRENSLTDLEEQILFLLEVRESQMSLTDLTEKVSIELNMSVPMAKIHETVWKLVSSRFIMIIVADRKRKYAITASGRTALQDEWSKYNRREVYNR